MFVSCHTSQPTCIFVFVSCHTSQPTCIFVFVSCHTSQPTCIFCVCKLSHFTTYLYLCVCKVVTFHNQMPFYPNAVLSKCRFIQMPFYPNAVLGKCSNLTKCRPIDDHEWEWWRSSMNLCKILMFWGAGTPSRILPAAHKERNAQHSTFSSFRQPANFIERPRTW